MPRTRASATQTSNALTRSAELAAQAPQLTPASRTSATKPRAKPCIVAASVSCRTRARIAPEPRRVLRRLQLLRGWSHDEANPTLFPEVRERAVRMVLEHQGEHSSPYAAIRSIAAKIGCSGETLRNWVRQAERDRGVRAGPTTEERERIKALERENRELRQANEILRKASAYFAMAELDRRSRS